MNQAFVFFSTAPAETRARQLADSVNGRLAPLKAGGNYIVIELPGKNHEELYTLLRSLETAAGVLRVSPAPYSSPPRADKIISEGGSRYPIDEVLIRLPNTASQLVAEQIAASVKGVICGFEPVLNLYTVRLAGETSRDRLERVIENLRRDARVQQAMRNIQLSLEPDVLK